MPKVITQSTPLYDQFKAGAYKPSAFQELLFAAFEKANHSADKARLRVAYPSYFGPDEYEASVSIFCNGDRSVGIGPFGYSMTIHRDLISNKEDRELMREDINKFYADICDGFKRTVSFDDEINDND